MLKFFMHLLILGKVMTTTKASSGSCPVSRKTVKDVGSCPVTLEERRKAATRKNCSGYADQCDDPDKLVYHCVINAYVNKTLEVCAIQQYIVGGFCAEYSERGNVIQSNFNSKCAAFMSSPCTNFYLSSEAYKYPGCYNLVMTPAPTTDSTANVSTTSMNVSREDKPLPIILTIVSMVIIIMIVTVLFLLKKKCFKMKDHQEEPKNSTALHQDSSNKEQQENGEEAKLLKQNGIGLEHPEKAA